ncbi:MAG: hypothetical protein ACM3ZE_00925, partial [Myxococcales bacterium]
RHKSAGWASPTAASMMGMNTSNIIVRLDAEHHAAEIEIMTPHGSPRSAGLETTLRWVGLRTLRTVEFSTPRHRVTRTKVARLDGLELDAARIAGALRAVSGLETNRSPRPFSRAA